MQPDGRGTLWRLGRAQQVSQTTAPPPPPLLHHCRKSRHQEADCPGDDHDDVLQDKAWAPIGGLFGEKLVNVLDVTLELRKLFGSPAD